MKKMFSKMWAMAMCLLIVSCSSEGDGIINDDNQVVCFVATISDVSTRVAYDDVNDYLKVSWEVGDEVVLSNGVDDYTFHVTKVNDDRSAQLSYAGPIDNATNFTGTATYAPWGNSAVQKANGNTEHLKYGEKMVATLSRVNLTTSPRVNFSHPETAVYKILYKVPEDCAAGSTLEMSGAWGGRKPSVSFDFPLNKDEILTAYIISEGGAIDEEGTLSFVFTMPKTANSVSTTIGGDEYHYAVDINKSLAYEVGKYWVADIRFLPIKAHAVDLGVGDVKWADCNVNATSPESFGQYFAFGDLVCGTLQQENGLWFECTYRSDRSTISTHYDSEMKYWTEENFYYLSSSQYHRLVLTESIIGTENDVATQKLGESWQMPTMAEWNTLMTECSVTEVMQNNTTCLKIVGKDGKYIILPFAGYKYNDQISSAFSSSERCIEYMLNMEEKLAPGCYYWTGEGKSKNETEISPYTEYYYTAYCFAYNQTKNWQYIYYGMPVRGVKK